MGALKGDRVFFLVEPGRQFRVGVFKAKIRYFPHVGVSSVASLPNYGGLGNWGKSSHPVVGYPPVPVNEV